MRYIIINGDSPRTRRAESKAPNNVYMVTGAKYRRRRQKNSQNKLHVNTYTKERMFPSVIVTKVKVHLF